MSRYYIAVVLSLTAVAPPAVRPVLAQEQASAIRWWHGALVVGGLSALSLLDDPARSFFQGHRSSSLDGVADAVRPFGGAKVYLGVTGGLYAVGVVSHNAHLTEAGSRMVTAFGVAILSSQAGKLAVGRSRPSPTTDADDISPFSGRSSMPSGHATFAFTLATELAHDIHRPWATAGLYTLATAVGWSRLNDDRHWLTDVGAGAILGVTAANVADGRWRLFHLHPPHLMLGPHHRIGIGWDAPL